MSTVRFAFVFLLSGFTIADRGLHAQSPAPVPVAASPVKTQVASPSNLLAPDQLLKVGWEAERDERWDDAASCFQLFLIAAPDAPEAAQVQAELKNISWRVSFLKSPDAAQIPQQRKDETDARAMLELGLPLDAARKTMDMIGRRPRFWQSYFIAAAAFERLGDHPSARRALELGAPFMDAVQITKAQRMMFLIDAGERQTSMLRRIDSLLKESKNKEAADLAMELIRDCPSNVSYRKLAIQACLMAIDRRTALALATAPVTQPDGTKIEMVPEVRQKLIAEIGDLLKSTSPSTAQSGKSRASATKPASKTTKKSSSTMADDFLNRIKR